MTKTNKIMSIATAGMILTGAIAGVAATTAQPVDAKSAKPIIEEIDYDVEDKEVNIDFYGRVKYKKLKVKIYPMNSSSNKARYIIERDSDDIEVKTKRLQYGRKYKAVIKGVARRGSSKYYTITKTFRALDD